MGYVFYIVVQQSRKSSEQHGAIVRLITFPQHRMRPIFVTHQCLAVKDVCYTCKLSKCYACKWNCILLNGFFFTDWSTDRSGSPKRRVDGSEDSKTDNKSQKLQINDSIDQRPFPDLCRAIHFHFNLFYTSTFKIL